MNSGETVIRTRRLESQAARWGQVLPAGPDDGMSAWQAADRALAEITAAKRAGKLTSSQDRARLERATTVVRDSLLEAAQAAAEAARRARALADSLDAALAAIGESAQEASMPLVLAPVTSGQSLALSQREREVLRHVAEGHSNKVIAAELYVSPNTVKTHVSSLLRKLDVHTRAQLATIAVQHGL